jgi:hypothetical protein
LTLEYEHDTLSPSIQTFERRSIVADAGLAFLFVAPGVDPEEHRHAITIPGGIQLLTIGAKDYEQAARVAKQLVMEGIQGIELCAGFGHKGVAMIAEAVDGKIPIGVVRFDHHPSLDHKSGDAVFAK